MEEKKEEINEAPLSEKESRVADAEATEVVASEKIDNPATEEEVRKVEDAADEELRITNRTIELLRTVFDPEIPVNVYDLG
ncbi:MAG: hypothetical protein K2K95_07095, partial [Muribaculaceae bacterium]|nr:hypothetical protein [Muribaculaceae bacterium]